jgi:hypothetical protein
LTTSRASMVTNQLLNEKFIDMDMDMDIVGKKVQNYPQMRYKIVSFVCSL